MNFFDSVKSISNYIWQSPSNKGQKLYRFFLAGVWQIYKRTIRLPLISKLDNGAKFILEPYSTNSTGNIYVKTYEAEYIYFLRKNILKGGIMLDIGAHMGLYTLLLKDMVESGYCFEPASDNFHALSCNLFINNLTKKFIAIKAAVSEKQGKHLLKKEGVFSGVNYLKEDLADDLENVEEVNTVTIDCFMKEQIKPRRPVTFIKIDTEGNELKVLKGAQETLRSNPGLIILFENSSNNKQFFSDINYKVFCINKSGQILWDEGNLSKSYNLFAVGSDHLLFKIIG